MIIAGTGHRPKYCPCGYDESHPWLENLRKVLKEKILEKSPDGIITGMAIGFDTWLAEAAIETGTYLSCYVPFEDQGKTWPPKAYKKYLEILDRADCILYVSQEYSRDCFLKRDRAMVEDADEIFCLLNSSLKQSGTYYTVNYAKQKGKLITNFWEQ